MAGEEIQVAIHPEDEGGFWAEVEGAAGCITQAANNTQALERLRDAHAAWSEAPAPAAPPADPGPPPNGVPGTAGEVAAWLAAAGWSVTKESEHHFVFAKGEPCVRVVLPKAGDEALTSGYREALRQVVKG